MKQPYAISQCLQENVWTSEQTSNDNVIYDGEEFDLIEMDDNTRDDGDDDTENYDNHFTTRQEYMHLDIAVEPIFMYYS
jgi:hypothetical protein